MRFRGKMNNIRNAIFVKNGAYSSLVLYIRLFKSIIWLILNIGKVFEITGIGKRIYVYHQIVWVLIYKPANYMGTDKSRPTSDKNFFYHNFLILRLKGCSLSTGNHCKPILFRPLNLFY